MAEYAVELHNVWYSHNGSNHILKDIDLKVKRGALLALIGPSGSGKTTLLKIICRLIRPCSGSISIRGSNGDLERHEVGYIPQQLGLVRGLTALENVLVGAHSRIGFAGTLLGVFPEKEIELAMKYLDMAGIAGKADKKVYTLSGGERQRVAIARALMQEPEIILADEFVSNLDIVTAKEIMDMMKKIKEKDTTLVIATHDISLARDYCDMTVIIKNGVKIDEICSYELDYDRVRDIFT
ncbi:ABC-type phosphate/phosphonate transport system, ATPase component [Candidatus Methanoperedens nitroreducens]|uniref:ABC-type phosphate/phosphonate transport system, ATPase component n=1 Tax=Candidatus Methanoperedens nitratireducens TaxID=1392998 RepID=A0A062UUZ8_9EURY|nr:ATP-binding cassette domain-containing protein [Candidatus Methanoperedens nitroreducens]KCZ70851.1 ABC-type phosphate/phosphonate transport system, ATPase component [Candidatus Methanoperedens nitroreducens]MDJ1420706.1 ATP-binding cassette domain-containing protein [Candidatus Methanoperedens sp.]